MPSKKLASSQRRISAMHYLGVSVIAKALTFKNLDRVVKMKQST